MGIIPFASAVPPIPLLRAKERALLTATAAAAPLQKSEAGNARSPPRPHQPPTPPLLPLPTPGLSGDRLGLSERLVRALPPLLLLPTSPLLCARARYKSTAGGGAQRCGGGRGQPFRPARPLGSPACGRRVRVGRFEYYEGLPPLCWHSVCLLRCCMYDCS